MGDRLSLHNLLSEVVEPVYFQAPTNTRLTYPCILYHKEGVDQTRADNETHFMKTKYLVTLVYIDPDTTLGNEILKLPYSSFDRAYTADGLYHEVYSLFF
jgi:hypothetical protein